jgi:hypothetical protein
MVTSKMKYINLETPAISLFTQSTKQKTLDYSNLDALKIHIGLMWQQMCLQTSDMNRRFLLDI